MLPLLSESSQTCKSSPQLDAATIPLQPSMQDGRHVDGYRLEVGLPKGKVLLGVDTAASGVYLSRAVAQANGFEYRLGDPADTMHADSLEIGPLTFRDCVVGVSDTPFPGKGAGTIGTDLFGCKAGAQPVTTEERCYTGRSCDSCGAAWIYAGVSPPAIPSDTGDLERKGAAVGAPGEFYPAGFHKPDENDVRGDVPGLSRWVRFRVRESAATKPNRSASV